jgi:hypothetical protein
LKDSAKNLVILRRLSKNDTTHFPSCQELKENENDFIDFAEFKEVISEISEEFHTRFNDFDSLKPKLQLFNNQMDIEVTQQPFDLQMESSVEKMNLQKLTGKCYLKRSSPSFEYSPLKCCHYLEARMFVKLHIPL